MLSTYAGFDAWGLLFMFCVATVLRPRFKALLLCPCSAVFHEAAWPHSEKFAPRCPGRRVGLPLVGLPLAPGSP